MTRLGGLFIGLVLLASDDSLERVRTLIAEAKYAEAKTALAAMETSSPQAEYLRGILHFNLREYAEAAKNLRTAVDVLPESGTAWSDAVQMLARSYYLSGRHAEAIPWLEKARTSGVNRQEVLFMLGNANLRVHAADRARAAFGELYGLAADSAGAYLITAQMMVRSQLEELAEAQLARALELDPKLPGAHFLRGELAIFRGDLDNGIAELKREIAINPNFAGPYWRLGDAYVRQQRYDAAIPVLQKSVWLNPTFSGPYILLGKAYSNLEQYVNAEAVLRRALEMDPQNSSAHYLLGTVLVRMGRAEEGKRLLRRSVELKGTAANAGPP